MEDRVGGILGTARALSWLLRAPGGRRLEEKRREVVS